MKLIGILTFILISFSAFHKKAEVNPQTLSTSTNTSGSKSKVIPDSAMLQILLGADSINTDETMFVFNHKYSPAYVLDEDAPYFQGFGQVNLASISSDHRDLAISGLPYTPGMSIGLDVKAKTSGTYFFEISYQRKIPASVAIWMKDSYLKDSVDLCTRNYTFKVNKTDTNSFGKKRFKITLKVKTN